MRSVIIRSRPDGVIELAPRAAPLAAGNRVVVVMAILLVTIGLYLGAVLPPAIAGIVAVACVAGELILGVKAAALARLRPVAQVHAVRDFRRREFRRRG